MRTHIAIRIAIVLIFWSAAQPAETQETLQFANNRASPDSAFTVSMGPRIAALQLELSQGNRDVLDAFWLEVAGKGAPLIEPVRGDPSHLLVTFLWRAKGPTRNVLMSAPGNVALQAEAGGNQLTRLLDTDVWYKTLRLRTDVRMAYGFSPNAASTPAFTSPEVQPDPLNPHVVVYTPSDPDDSTLRESVRSVLALPAAPTQPYVERRPGVPTGLVEKHLFKSTILGNDRTVYVYTPPDYRASGPPYTLLVLFDGLAFVQVTPTPTILDNLLAEAAIPPMVAVIVSNPVNNGAARSLELPAYQPFADALATEIIPWVRQRYHVTHDPMQTIVGGMSFGGLAAAHAALRRPEIFGNVLSLSGSYWWTRRDDTEDEWLTRQFLTSPRLAVRFWMNVGLLESPAMVLSNRHLRDILQLKGYSVQYSEFSGSHDRTVWRGLLADGLKALIGTEDRRGGKAAMSR